MKVVIPLILIVCIQLSSCSNSSTEGDNEMSEEQMDQQVEDQLEEDQERYDSMKRELGL